MAKKQSKKIKSKDELVMLDALIPSEIYNNKNLSKGAKVFYGVIMNLSNKHGYAFAGTQTLAKYIGRKPRSVQYHIAELDELRLVKVWFHKGKRFIKPLVLPEDNNDQFVIPSEVVCSTTDSSTIKLSYGLVQYKSTNDNDYFALKNIHELADLLDVSISTAYRHLKAFENLNLAKVEKSNSQIKIITMNSYKTKVFNNLTKRQTEANLAPPEASSPMKISPSFAEIESMKQIEKLKQLGYGR